MPALRKTPRPRCTKSWHTPSPAGDVGFWQGAFRDQAEPIFARAREAIEARRRLTIDLLYGDHEGGQRTISRFALTPRDDGRWLTSVARHWSLDRADPR